jgi:hypothetical protein
MSPMRRTSSFSIASWPSRRLRSRMRTCDSVGLDQMAGSDSFDSREASSLSSLARSKILPKVADFVANGSVGKFEFVEHDDFRGAGGEFRPGQR